MSLLINKSVIDALLTFTALIVLGALGTSAIISAISIPDVQFSYSTNECVKVLNYVEGDMYSCENLPAKFNNIWVK